MIVATRRLVLCPSRIIPQNLIGTYSIRFINSDSAVQNTSSSLTPSLAKDPLKVERLFTPPAQLRERANEIIRHRQKDYSEDGNQETLEHKFYRWCDLFGFFSRWNSRKYWCLTSPPFLRLSAVMMTEYERKIHLWREVNIQIFFWVTLFVGWIFYYYRSSRQPLPQVVGLEGPYRATMGYFGVLPLQYPKKRCPHCRLYDPECRVSMIQHYLSYLCELSTESLFREIT